MERYITSPPEVTSAKRSLKMAPTASYFSKLFSR